MEVFKFVKEVKKEATKISWLSKKEAAISALMVVAVVFVFGLMVVFADYLIYHIVQFLMNVGV
jgi:preprotein translocase SecE subunit